MREKENILRWVVRSILFCWVNLCRLFVGKEKLELCMRGLEAWLYRPFYQIELALEPISINPALLDRDACRMSKSL